MSHLILFFCDGIRAETKREDGGFFSAAICQMPDRSGRAPDVRSDRLYEAYFNIYGGLSDLRRLVFLRVF